MRETSNTRNIRRSKMRLEKPYQNNTKKLNNIQFTSRHKKYELKLSSSLRSTSLRETIYHTVTVFVETT